MPLIAAPQIPRDARPHADRRRVLRFRQSESHSTSTTRLHASARAGSIGLTSVAPRGYAWIVSVRLPIILCAAILLLTGIVRADSVHDGRGSFSGVEIIGFSEDRLAFRMADGRIVSRPALSVKQIRVMASHDRMGEVLTEGDKLRLANNPLEAIARYKQVEANARTTWMQEFAIFRQAQMLDTLGAFPQALNAYMTLTRRAPRVAALVIPRNLPPPKTPEAAEAVDAVKFAERSSPPEDIAVILVRLRHAIQTGTPFEKESPTSKPAVRKTAERKAQAREGEAPSDADVDKPVSRDRKRPPAVKQQPAESDSDDPAPKPKADAPAGPAGGKLDGLAKVFRQALSDGKLELAEKTLDRAKGYAKGADRAMYILMTAELLLTQKYYDRAGLECMRVVVEYPGNPVVGRALYCAGLSYEGLERPSKALELFEEAVRNSPNDPETREAASARAAALKKAADDAVEIP